MYQRRIALDNSLEYYRPLLIDEGYEVIDMNAKGTEAEAILLSGQDDNVTGDARRASDAFVLDVAGRQPDEVLYDLRQHFALKDESPRIPF